MNLLMIPRLAAKALAQNAMRTSLTMLGIIIGMLVSVTERTREIGLRQAVGASG